MQIAFLCVSIYMWLGYIYSFILSLEFKKCAWDFIVVNIVCWWRSRFSRWFWTLIKCDQSDVVSFHLKKLHYQKVSLLPDLCGLVLKGQICAFEIACGENLELEEHSEKRALSIFYFYLVTKKNTFNGPFLWMGFNCLKARATPKRQFTFYH